MTPLSVGPVAFLFMFLLAPRSVLDGLIVCLAGIGGDEEDQSATPKALSYPWTDAIINAVSDPNANLDMVPSCPSGNCTWSTFASLGFCSNCRNMTSYVRQHTDCQIHNLTLFPDVANLSQNYTTRPRSWTTCKYGMPSSRNGNVLVTDSAVSSEIDDLAWWPDGGG